MDIKKLQKVVIDALEDVKAQDIKMYDTTHLTSLFDRLCIASGTSNRQTKALAASVRDKVKQKNGHIISIEGDDLGEWVLVDLGDMIVHIMQPVIREYYRLEELWGEKEVKFGAAKRSSKSKLELSAAEDEKAETKTRSKRKVNQATQTTVDDDEKPAKTVKKSTGTRSKASTEPAVKRSTRTSSAKSATDKPAAAKKKKAVGTTVKVAASKSSVASAKKAAAKKAAAPRSTTRSPRKTAS